MYFKEIVRHALDTGSGYIRQLASIYTWRKTGIEM